MAVLFSTWVFIGLHHVAAALGYPFHMHGVEREDWVMVFEVFAAIIMCLYWIMNIQAACAEGFIGCFGFPCILQSFLSAKFLVEHFLFNLYLSRMTS